MFSSVARIASSRLAVRTVVNTTRKNQNLLAFARPMQPSSAFIPMRHFAGSTFLDAQEVSDRILEVVKKFEKVDPNKVTPDTNFVNDLGLDSLDAVEIVMAIEDEFAIEIPDAEADKIQSVKDAVEYIAGHPMAK